MRFGNRRDDEGVDINLTPLIDVVFLLLIFFMVTTTFREEGGLNLRLPEAEQTRPPAQAPVTVNVDAEGHYRIAGAGDAAADREALRSALAARFDGDGEQGIIIRADGETPHQAVIRVMDVAAELGIDQIQIGAVDRTGER